jgi:hypothetical protein
MTQVAKPKGLLDAGNALHGIIEAVLAESLVFDLLELLDQFAESGVTLSLRTFRIGASLGGHRTAPCIGAKGSRVRDSFAASESVGPCR